jgi:hypothetical protein
VVGKQLKDNIMEFTIDEGKSFTEDIKIIFDAIKSKENFAFSKSADGEMKILMNENIDILNKCNGEFKYDKDDNSDKLYRDKLIESFTYKHPKYFIGIGCPCCIGDTNYNWMKNITNQSPTNLTWANIFVNGNYKFYVDNFIPEYKNHKIIMVCNQKANLDDLFSNNLVKDFRIGTNAWKNDYNIIEEIKKYIDENNIKNHLFLFAAGPFGNILVYELFKHNNDNIYLDIGSTLDPLIGLGGTRGYHVGKPTINKICNW